MLTNEFIACCKSFANKHNNVLSENIEDSKKICTYKIEFYSYILEFRYVKKESVYFKPSSLYCVLSLRKNSVVYYHLTDIIPFLENKSFKSCYFWCIENEERLHNCFESLTSSIEKIISQIEPLLYDDSVLKNALFESYKNIY